MRSLIRDVRSRSARDDEGSGLILVFLVLLISSALSLVLLESAVSMAKQTQANNKRITSLAAAQAGLDSALGQIRDAVDPVTGNGSVATIPCSVGAGTVGGIGSPTEGTTGGNYTVSVAYFNVNPSAQAAAWRANSANQINCPTGSHPDKVPTYALVTATGTAAGSKPRSIETTYIFTTTNKNISGGLLQLNGGGEGSSLDLCPDAGSAHPAAGDQVTMQLCDPNKLTQRWAYQADLSFLLTSTTNDQLPKVPMCMAAAGSPAPNNTVLKMQPCTGLPVSTTGVTIQQQFSYDDNGRFENSKVSGGKPTLAGTCVNVTTANTAGSTLTIGGCGTVWRPQASVGAGMSGDATTQLVNYKEFGRCLDATGQDPNATFMIAYPCKQSPSPSEITWNQKYSFNGVVATGTPGSISTYDTSNGVTYCLNSPMVAEPSITSLGQFVTLKPCTSPLTTNMKWIEYKNTTGNYINDYTIRDASNPKLCLGVGLTGTGVPAASGLGEWSSLYVQVCDGSLGQKWNAPPNVPTGSVTDTNELPTGG